MPAAKKFLKFNENEGDMLRPNNFLDFINIILIFVFIILFYIVFTVIVFANPYFWVIKI